MEEAMGCNGVDWPGISKTVSGRPTVTTVGAPMEQTEKPKKKREYSKAAITAMIVLWFVGAVFGMAVVVWQLVTAAYTVNISDVLLYIGAPMTGGIVGYLAKSATENKEKIKKDTSYEESGGRAE